MGTKCISLEAGLKKTVRPSVRPSTAGKRERKTPERDFRMEKDVMWVFGPKFHDTWKEGGGGFW